MKQNYLAWPKPCFIFNLSDRDIIYQNGEKTASLENECVLGNKTKYIPFDIPETLNLLIVEFHETGLRQVFGEAANVFTDTSFSIEEILSSEEYRYFFSKLNDCISVTGKIAFIESFICEQYQKRSLKMEHNVICDLIGIISNSGGSITAKDLAGKAGYSDRHLRRLFKEYIGISTKDLISISKFTHTIQCMNRMRIKDPSINITEILYHLDYYDHSHFIKSFKKYAGIRPNEMDTNPFHIQMKSFDLPKQVTLE